MSVRKVGVVINTLLAIAILAVIITLAEPAWRTHTTRTHITQALKAADGAKLVVMEAATTRGGLDRMNSADLVYDGGNSSNPYVASLSIDVSGHIKVATRNTGASPDPVLELVPAEAASAQKPAPIAWSCVVVRGKADAVPDDCRAAPSEAPGTPVPAASVAH
jgi:type IV pilus assembly protein PilA